MKIKIFGRTFEIRNSVQELPRPSDETAWSAYLSGRGYPISALSALKVSAVLRCVDVVAKTMASLPLNLFVKTANGQQKAGGHPIYKLLNRLPNKETTSYEFWHFYVFNLMLTKGAYAKIVRDSRGVITALWNIPTANVTMYRNVTTGERYIVVVLDPVKGISETLYEENFMYTPGLRFSSDFYTEDPISIAADVLGLTQSLNGFAKDFFERGSNLGGFLEAPASLSETAYTHMMDSWAATYSGVMNQHKIALLEEGVKYTQLGAKLNDSQALEQRQFAVIEICRIFGVPPHLVYELTRSTFSNIEQQNIQFVQDALTPMSVRLEQTMYKDLLTYSEQNIYFAKWNLNGLLRGDIAARTAYYKAGRNDGWMNANEIRALEDMNSISKEDGGDAYLCNGNFLTLANAMGNLPKSLQNKGGTGQ